MLGAWPLGHKSTASTRMRSSRGLSALRGTTSTASAQQFLKILNQADVIKKRGTRLEVHQEVQIAVWARLLSGN
jgi:hypothetical protein